MLVSSLNYDGSKSTWEVIVFPPPKYKAVSISSKRIQSLGEGGKSTAKSSQRNREGARTTKETETTATQTLSESLMDDMLFFQEFQKKTEILNDQLSTHRDRHSSIKEINSLKVEIQLLNEQLQKMSEKKRSTQRCSYCQETGHTYLHCEVLLTGGQGVVKPSDL